MGDSLKFPFLVWSRIPQVAGMPSGNRKNFEWSGRVVSSPNVAPGPTYILLSHIQIWLSIWGSYAGFVLLCFNSPPQKKPWCRWPNISNAMQLHWSCTSWGGNLLARLAQRSLGTTNVEDFPCHDWRGHIGGKSKNSLCTLGWWHIIIPLLSLHLDVSDGMTSSWTHPTIQNWTTKTLRSRSAPIPGFHSMLAVCPSFHRSNLVAWILRMLSFYRIVKAFETFSHVPSLWTMNAKRKH